jgi:hypothetical protein
MTGETIRDLLTPLIGKPGTISLVVGPFGRVSFVSAENKKLTGVQLRPDGLLQLDRETGWTVLSPDNVLAVVWDGENEDTVGQFL